MPMQKVFFRFRMNHNLVAFQNCLIRKNINNVVTKYLHVMRPAGAKKHKPEMILSNSGNYGLNVSSTPT